jgi:hypothetical protein
VKTAETTEAPVTAGAAPSEPAAAETTAKAPIIVSMTSDAAVSETIKNALEDALEAEIAPKEAPAPVVDAAPTEDEPVEVTTAEAEPVETAPEEVAPPAAAAPQEAPTNVPAAQPTIETPVRATVPETNADAPVQESNAQAATQDTNTQDTNRAEFIPPKLDRSRWDRLSGTTYVNVMQILVEENAEKYMNMFGLCQCPRCVADVKALALNNLIPKYVVMREGEMVPRITLYEGRFQTAVTAQILRACQSVMANPRHDRTI